MCKNPCVKTSSCKNFCAQKLLDVCVQKLLRVKTSLCKSPCVCKKLLCVSSLQLSFGSRCRPVSICKVVSCGGMQRTCESIARLKIERKQRTKCCNLQHFALSDGKNPRKYHSFSPRKVAKTLLFTGFRSRHDLRFLEEHVNTNVFCVHQDKQSVQKVQKML